MAANLASPGPGWTACSPRSQATASEVAPVAETQAALFANLDTTFTALSGIARPFLQDFISQGPPTQETGIREFPRQRPFLRNSAAFFRELRPGVATLPASAPVLADALRIGTQHAAPDAAAEPPPGQGVRLPGRVRGGPAGAAAASSACATPPPRCSPRSPS